MAIDREKQLEALARMREKAHTPEAHAKRQLTYTVNKLKDPNRYSTMKREGGHRLTPEELRMGSHCNRRYRNNMAIFRDGFIKKLNEVVTPDGKTNADLLMEAMLSKASQDKSIDAAIFVRDTIGEKPVQKVEQSIDQKTINVTIDDNDKKD